jgi:hypothetical protein
MISRDEVSGTPAAVRKPPRGNVSGGAAAPTTGYSLGTLRVPKHRRFATNSYNSIAA